MQSVIEYTKNNIDKLTYNELISIHELIEYKIKEFKKEQIVKDAEVSIENYKNNKLKALEYDELIQELNS